MFYNLENYDAHLIMQGITNGLKQLWKFRRVCKLNYGLDPGNYYMTPGLSWDALLKYAGIKLELLTDIDKHLFFERAKRGGISGVF